METAAWARHTTHLHGAVKRSNSDSFVLSRNFPAIIRQSVRKTGTRPGRDSTPCLDKSNAQKYWWAWIQCMSKLCTFLDRSVIVGPLYRSFSCRNSLFWNTKATISYRIYKYSLWNLQQYFQLIFISVMHGSPWLSWRICASATRQQLA